MDGGNDAQKRSAHSEVSGKGSSGGAKAKVGLWRCMGDDESIKSLRDTGVAYIAKRGELLDWGLIASSCGAYAAGLDNRAGVAHPQPSRKLGLSRRRSIEETWLLPNLVF